MRRTARPLLNYSRYSSSKILQSKRLFSTQIFSKSGGARIPSIALLTAAVAGGFTLYNYRHSLIAEHKPDPNADDPTEYQIIDYEDFLEEKINKIVETKGLTLKLKPGEFGDANAPQINPAYNAGLTKQEAKILLNALLHELNELQELMYGAGTHSVLLILQGRDTSGKDGAVLNVFQTVNPQGVSVSAFKVPTEEEAAHDFLWRVHSVVPPKGLIGIFNRSHYEDVLVPFVSGMDKKKLAARYKLINDFEKLLINEGNTIIIKTYFHISKEEQAERLIARQKNPGKAFKLSPSDWEARSKWDNYTDAYKQVFLNCNSEEAPWHLIPADRKWFRNLALAHLVVTEMRKHKAEWEKKMVALREERLPAVLEAQEKSKHQAKHK